MIKDVLQSISNVEIFAIISLLLILTSFIVILVYTLKINKEDLKRFSRLPLDESDMLWTATARIDNKNGISGE
jgi:hypothetical protein